MVLETDMEERQVTEAQSWEKMRQTWEAMLESAVSYRAEQRSCSGLVGGNGARMRAYAASGKAYSGDYVQEVIATALSVGECNACMRKIVAAPTAGACGVLPAVLVPLYQAGEGHRGGNPEGAVYRLRHRRGHQLPGLPLPVRPAAVRRRSAPPPPWRQGRWPLSGAATASRSAMPRPWH